MSEVFYASVDVFDPDGQSQLEAGEVYGGEARLFVLAGEGLQEAMERLLVALAEKGMSLVRVRAAGPVGGFETSSFPFPIDLGPMIEDASASGRICATPPAAFAPRELEWSYVSLGLAEIVDRSRLNGGDYAGEYVQFAVRGAVALTLAQLFDTCTREGKELKSLDDVQDAAFCFGMDPFGNGTITDVIGRATEALTWGTSYEYPQDDDAS